MIEAVEVCPYCEAENVYPDYDVETDGYVVKCGKCGKQIFLCDECVHADDCQGCDWEEAEDETLVYG